MINCHWINFSHECHQLVMRIPFHSHSFPNSISSIILPSILDIVLIPNSLFRQTTIQTKKLFIIIANGMRLTLLRWLQTTIQPFSDFVVFFSSFFFFRYRYYSRAFVARPQKWIWFSLVAGCARSPFSFSYLLAIFICLSVYLSSSPFDILHNNSLFEMS